MTTITAPSRSVASPGQAPARPIERPTIPLARPDIGPREMELVRQVLESGTLALGPFAAAFESSVAALSGRQFGLATSSGTAGLHLSIRALGIGHGDEVITTPFSFVASANCILYERATPRFVDIEEDRLGLDPDAVRAAIGRRTRAVLPVHVFGRGCRIAEISATAREHGLAVVEDACEGLGSRVGDRPLGGFGDMAVFAFYPNKQITTGEGGVVVTDDPIAARLIRSLRNQGRDDDGTWLRHVRLGWNYRLDEMSAAVGVAQLERLDELRAGRRRVVEAYERALGRFDWVRLPASTADESVDWFVYVVRLDEWIDRDRVITELAARGIPVRPYFTPLHLQPLYRDRFGFRPGDFPVTERIAATTLALPFSSTLTDDGVATVADALAAVVG